MLFTKTKNSTTTTTTTEQQYKLMNKVTFYISSKNADQNFLDLFCKIIQKAFREKKKVFIFNENVDELRALDDYLWVFNPNSFIAHDLILTESMLENTEESMSDIVLSNIDPSANDKKTFKKFNDILINANNNTTIPSFVDQFHRVIEVIDQSSSRLKNGRIRYKTYVDHAEDYGCEIEIHKID